MIRNSKFIYNEFEWYWKEVPNHYILFWGFRYLRPLKIILNCKDEEYGNLFAQKFLNFIIYLLMMKKNMNEKYLKLKEQIDFIDAHLDYKN